MSTKSVGCSIIRQETTAMIRAKTAVRSFIMIRYVRWEQVCEVDLAMLPHLFIESRRNRATSQSNPQIIIVAIEQPKKEIDCIKISKTSTFSILLILKYG